MQKLEDGSQGQEILEEPAVTETTLSPDEDPKMVNELTWGEILPHSRKLSHFS